MDQEFQFRFSIRGLPAGEALTGSEIEEKMLEKLDASSGTCLDTLWSLAVLYQKTGHLDEASGCIQHVIDLTDDPEKIASGCLALGQCEELRGDFVAASIAYRKALALEPCSTPTWYFIHNNLGYSLNQLEDYESAAPFLSRAVEIDPTRPNAYKNLALALMALGDLEKAADLFITATQVDAADSRSLDHLDELLQAHPVLEIDIPDLRDRVDACRQAVEIVQARQPDINAHWAKLREAQQRRWWQFWK